MRIEITEEKDEPKGPAKRVRKPKAAKAVATPEPAAAEAAAASPAPTATNAPATVPVPAVAKATPAASPRKSASRTAEGAWDLHMHSTFSDGSCTVDELVALAREASLAGIAVTDHDCLRQLSAIRARSRELGFPVLAGIEVSAMNPATGRKVHVLGYGLEATPDASGPVERIVNETLRARTANTLWQAWVLERTGAEFGGHTVSLDEVVAVAGQSTGVYKQHIMEALTHRPYTDPDYQFAYWCNLKGESPANHDITYPVATDAVRAIREQGGVPVLAHPGQMDSWDYVGELVAAGLEGIEAFHPDHDEADEDRAFELAREHGLFVTGGSDFHGRFGKPEAPGCRFVAPEEAGERVAELFEREQGLS